MAWRQTIAWVSLWLSAGAHASDPADRPETLQVVSSAAATAQARCHGQVHHDTFAFERCVLDVGRQDAKTDAARLGTDYFGYVGAMNSARMGMMGAEESALVFLIRFRTLQRRMHVSDRGLCQTVPGDCDVRIATVRHMEKTAAKHLRRHRDESDEAQHVH